MNTEKMVFTWVPAMLNTAGLYDPVWERTYFFHEFRRLIFDKRFVTIGRSSRCDIALCDDVLVSRRHARIERRSDGFAVLSDAASTNGTYVNDRPVRWPIPLIAGMRVRVGDTSLVAVNAAGMFPASDDIVNEFFRLADDFDAQYEACRHQAPPRRLMRRMK